MKYVTIKKNETLVVTVNSGLLKVPPLLSLSFNAGLFQSNKTLVQNGYELSTA